MHQASTCAQHTLLDTTHIAVHIELRTTYCTNQHTKVGAAPKIMATNGDDSAKSTRWATDEDFGKHRKLITELYENGTLPNLMHTMQTEHDFFATPKMYKTRFRRWGLWKHNQASHVAEIIRLKTQRDAAQKSSEFLLHGRRVDLARIESYLRRNEKMRRHVTSLAARRGDTSPFISSSDTAVGSLVCRTPSPEPQGLHLRAPDALHNEESMYRAIRDYYSGAFGSRRWVFEEDVLPEGRSAGENTLAVERTRVGLRHGQEIWLRFRTALNCLERSGEGGMNGGLEGDYAQGVRLIRISFAEVSDTILSGYEAPMLFFWLLDIMTLFRESRARDFRPIETQLLKHLHDLTTATPEAARHPTSLLWRILWTGGLSMGRDRHLMRTCIQVALEEFERFNGGLHSQTVELLLLSNVTCLPPGVGDRPYKENRWRALYERLDGAGIFDDRLLDIVCSWAGLLNRNKAWHEAENVLLETVLNKPERANLLHNFPAGAFNVHSMLACINNNMERYERAEGYARKSISIAKRARQKHGDGDLFEGLERLEVCLRKQGRTAEAEAALLERQALVKETLEKMGEKEDCV